MQSKIIPEIEILPIGSNSSNGPSQVRLPGSKYTANRLLPLCALASTPSVLTNVVDNNDINTAIKGLRILGYQLEQEGDCISIRPREQALEQAVSLNASHSGTFSRFVTGIAAIQPVPVTINCSEKMATRPMGPLFSALESLGVTIDSQNNRLPATIVGPVSSRQCEIDASKSSQFLSSLLIVSPLLKDGLTIKLVGEKVSESYVKMTLDWMAKMGVDVLWEGDLIQIAPGQKYQGLNQAIPGDPVSASYFMGFAAISGQTVEIQSFDHDSLQGESKFYQVLEKMGMKFEQRCESMLAIGGGSLRGIDVDMGNMPDVVQTLAVIAAFAEGETKMTNIAHLAYKESNRIVDTANELKKAGVHVEYGSDYLLVRGGTPRAATIATYDDHRMAMSMALLGIKTDGIKIESPEVVNKSFPTYWSLMASLGLKSVTC